MVDIPILSAIIAGTSVVIASVFAVFQLRNLVRTRQTDLVIRLYSAFSGRELQEAYFEVRQMEFVDYDDFMKKYRMPAKSIVQLWQVSKFFDGVGVLLRRKLVDIGLVDELFHTEATLLWEKVKPIAEGRRKELNQPTIYQCFEYLYNELKKREQRGVKNG
jgi:hypothetical protein